MPKEMCNIECYVLEAQLGHFLVYSEFMDPSMLSGKYLRLRSVQIGILEP
jgi:hypothetical protein